MNKKLKKILKQADLIENESKQLEFLEREIEAIYDELTDSEIEEFYKESDKTLELMNKLVDEIKAMKKNN